MRKIDNIKEKLEVLFDYYLKSRRSGHTGAMLKGCDKDTIILAISCNFLSVLKNMNFSDYKKVISFRTLKNTDFRGLNNPILIDNSAMEIMLETTLNYIDILEIENRQLKKNCFKL